MMKYTDKYWKFLMPFMRKRLNKKYGKEYTKALIVKADGVYRDMLKRVDNVGEDNPMASNIYECLVVLAIWKAADGKISVSDLREMCVDLFSMPVLKVVGLFVNGNKESGLRKFRKMIEKDAAWLDEHPEYKAVSWDFNFDDTKHKEGFYYHFTQCPLNNFARREGCLEVLPVMCDVDFLTAKLMHFKLHREHTLAGGGEVCDYWYVADKIQNAYESSKNIYDDVLTQGNFFSRLYIKLFWSGTDDNEIARKVLSYIPDDFAGNLLDVPVGTAVFTEHKWASLKNACITCLDYSMDMLEQARKRLDGHAQIRCIQGDVGNLQMDDESFDIVLSMNGFHAFPDKKKAFQETWRVLKPGGKFIACFYIKGKSGITDWLVKNILSKKGWFTPPFPTEEQLKKILNRLYKEVDFHIDGSMVYFCCTK